MPRRAPSRRAPDWDEAARRWRLRTSHGDEVSCRHYIMASGCLSLPKTPDIEGVDRYRGEVYFTGRWPHDKVDFSGKNVAVGGTGSSGIQCIPLIAAEAARATSALTVAAEAATAGRPVTVTPRRSLAAEAATVPATVAVPAALAVIVTPTAVAPVPAARPAQRRLRRDGGSRPSAPAPPPSGCGALPRARGTRRARPGRPAFVHACPEPGCGASCSYQFSPETISKRP